MAVLLPSRLTFKYPFGAASVAGFNPTQLPSLIVWVDPSQSATVTTGTGGISQINDLSGAGNNFAQGTVGQRPDYTGSLNGLNVMTCVSANVDTLICVNSVSHGPSLTIAGVQKATTAPAVNGIYSADDGSGPAENRWDSSTAPTSICFPGGTPTTVSGAGAPDITAAAHVFVAVFDNAAHTVTNFIDGTQNGSASGLGALPTVSCIPRLGMARFNGGNWNGIIGEVVVCNAALTTLQRQNLEAYLRAKWGTP